MLHQTHPSVVGCFFKFGLAFPDLFERDFLEFLGIGIERRAGKGMQEERRATRRAGMPGELIIRRQVDRLRAMVDHPCPD